MDPYFNFPSGSGTGSAQTAPSAYQNFYDPFSLQESTPNYLPPTSQKSYTLVGHDGMSQNQGTSSTQSFHPPIGSRFVTHPSSRSGHPYQPARLRHLVDRPHTRHQQSSQLPLPTVQDIAPTAPGYNGFFGDRTSGRCHGSSQGSLSSRKFISTAVSGSGSQSDILDPTTSQNMPPFMDSFVVPEQQLSSMYQMSAPLPWSPADQADVEYAQHRYGAKRCLYQCRFDLFGSPCNKWIVGDRTRVLRHLRNHHHLQTGPAAPAVCRWEKCTHTRAMKQENLSRHVVMHLGVKWRCLHCRRLFSRDDAVHRHIERMVPGMDVTEAEVVPGCEARAIGDFELKSSRTA